MLIHFILQGLRRSTHTRGSPPYKMLGMMFQKSHFGKMCVMMNGKTADATMKAMPNIKRVAGHALGGRTALELATCYGVETSTDGAPVVEMPTMPWRKKPIKPPERYRHSGDPISCVDAGAKYRLLWGIEPTLGMHNPHTYTGVADGI